MTQCCTSETFGYTKNWQKNAVQISSVLTALAAVAAVAIGIISLYHGVPQSTALWTQVGVLAGVAALAGVVAAISNKFSNWGSRISIAMAVITFLALPVIFGSLGAKGFIPRHDMLYAATSICGAVVVGAFIISITSLCREICNRDEDGELKH